MKKEVFLAISIGFALGLVITFGIWTANKSLKNLPKSSPTPSSTPQTETISSPTPSSQVTNAQLTISSPADEALVTTPKVTLTGSTSASSLITVIYENGQVITTADASGNFSLDVPLVGGYNVIKVASFDKSGTSAEQTLTVTYTTSKI